MGRKWVVPGTVCRVIRPEAVRSCSCPSTRQVEPVSARKMDIGALERAKASQVPWPCVA